MRARPRPVRPVLVRSLAALLAAVLSACAGAPPLVHVEPARVKEAPGPTDASGMGATATPFPSGAGASPAPRASAPTR